MLTLAPFTFCANNVPGTDPIRAMDMARRCGFHTIELSAIDGISEQIVAERVSPEYVMQIERELQKRDLQCTALSAHCDMTDEAQFARLLKKIEFAGQIGAQLVNTRCGPKARYAVFEEHVKRAAEAADRYGLRLGLESYGDIVGPASECGGVFAELNLPNVQYTYDPGNTYRFCRGEIRLDEDLQNASVPVAYLHMKDGSIHDGYIWNEPIGQGVFPYPAMLAALERQGGTLGCALEMPMKLLRQRAGSVLPLPGAVGRAALRTDHAVGRICKDACSCNNVKKQLPAGPKRRRQLFLWLLGIQQLFDRLMRSALPMRGRRCAYHFVRYPFRTRRCA